MLRGILDLFPRVHKCNNGGLIMSEVKVIGIGNDHAAVDLKNEIKAYLEEKVIKW